MKNHEVSSNHPFDALLNQIRKDCAGRNRDLGSAFERLLKKYLTTDSTQKARYKRVLTYATWAREQSVSEQDTGIDLVAERVGGGFVAIQAKCYQPGRTIKKKDIDSFMSASSKRFFVERMVVDTTRGEWSPHAREMLKDQQPVVSRLRLQDFRASDIDWQRLLLAGGKGKAWTFAKFKPRAHQRKALHQTRLSHPSVT